MIDIHHHILYGLDDGPADAETMQQMLKVASCDGVRTLIATPHIVPGIKPFPMDVFFTRLSEAQKQCDILSLDMRILSGAEILYTYQTARYLTEGRIPTLGGTNKVLIEFPENVSFETIKEAVQAVLRSANVPVLAHIERYRNLIFPVRRAEAFKKDFEVYYQINCDSILVSNNRRADRSIRLLLQHGKIDFVASDAHDCDKRCCKMKEAYERLVTMVGQEYADKLTGRHSTIKDYIGTIKSFTQLRKQPE
jgi:protein-tyrosine phosphatase